MAEPSKPTILVVDDDPDVRALAIMVLEDFGYDVHEAPGAAVALQILEQQAVDLLFTDIMMPGMNGFELAQAVRHARPDLAIVLTSGHLSTPLASAMADGLFPTLPKPWRAPQLTDAIAQALAASPAGRHADAGA